MDHYDVRYNISDSLNIVTMKRVIALVDCSIPINTRNQKIIDSIKRTISNAEIHVITWNREGVSLESSPYFHTYNRVAPYADAVAKLKGMYGFKKYIGEVLKHIRPEIIIASHWSNLVLVSGYKTSSQKLIYENLDIPTGGSIIRHISCFFERKSLKKVDLVVHASRFFRPLYKQSISQIILENKPTFSPNKKTSITNKPLKVAFIGSIRYKDILENLVNAIGNNEQFELYFHGGGEDLHAMQEYCKGISNVFFTGKYDYSKILELYHQSDIIWAAYPNRDYNVVYAISNKFHESLYVGVPCIYADHTKLADLVRQENIGFVVDPYNTSNIKDLFNDIASGKIDIDSVKKSMEEFQSKENTWENDFEQLVEFLK